MKRLVSFIILSFVTLSLSSCDVPTLIGGENNSYEGLYKSTDGGETWVHMNPITELPDNEALIIAEDPDYPGVLYYGSINTGIYKSWDKGETWENINAGLPVTYTATIKDIMFNVKNSNEIFLVGEFDSYGQVIVGTNGGENWKYLYSDIPDGSEIVSIDQDNNSPNHLYAVSTTRGFYESHDYGSTWGVVYWFSKTPSNIYVHPDLPTTIFVTIIRDGLYRSTDMGRSWEVVRDVLEDADYDILLSNPIRPQSVYVGGQNGLYYSEDFGTTWTEITETFPVFNPYVSNLVFHPTNPDILYLTSDKNIYITYNHGASWDVVKTPEYLDNAILDFDIDPRNPDIMYFSIGNGTAR
jgi:photosystem II stability/assembly factor-like uncharacterized protein